MFPTGRNGRTVRRGRHQRPPDGSMVIEAPICCSNSVSAQLPFVAGDYAARSWMRCRPAAAPAGEPTIRYRQSEAGRADRITTSNRVCNFDTGPVRTVWNRLDRQMGITYASWAFELDGGGDDGGSRRGRPGDGYAAGTSWILLHTNFSSLCPCVRLALYLTGST